MKGMIKYLDPIGCIDKFQSNCLCNTQFSTIAWNTIIKIVFLPLNTNSQKGENV